MLRHLKMELKRQQEAEAAQHKYVPPTIILGNNNSNQHTLSQIQTSQIKAKLTTDEMMAPKHAEKPRRVRGRRSSKPMMEKRRRARINECLSILKTFVLGDSDNLVRLGIDANAHENQDEETIARQVLKTSGLINRHRGRKNPNKLEKADILELTVDYVRQLHEQREHLLSAQANQIDPKRQPTQLLTPLQLPMTGAQIALTASIPPSPPNSHTSCSPQPLLAISSNQHVSVNYVNKDSSLSSDVLDLSNSRR